MPLKHPASLAFCAALVVCAVASDAPALTIVPTFMDGSGEVWDATKQAVVNQAISDWEARIHDNQTIDITFDFTRPGTNSYLGLWEGSASVPTGADMFPWTSGVTHMIHFNADLMDPTLPNYMLFTTGSIPFKNWDALSVARHELGHAMGVVNGFYYKNDGQPNAVDKWGSHIVGATFDPGGLNVPMDTASDPSELATTGSTAHDLMAASLFNGERRDISSTDLQMLELAYHYAMIPGDADRDGKVDFNDLVILARNYGLQTGATWDQGDFNNDGKVDFGDLVTLARHYGQDLTTATFTQPTAAQLAQFSPALQGDIEAAFAQVPEPGAMGLGAMSGLLLLRRRSVRPSDQLLSSSSEPLPAS